MFLTVPKATNCASRCNFQIFSATVAALMLCAALRVS
jgi:hypothetical protein